MKKQKQSTLDEALSDRVKPTGSIQKKKKKGEFEVRVPRIIVRNLGFNVKEEQLKRRFEELGSPISNVSIVVKDGKSKGFGFVTFGNLEDAQKAIQTMNGQKLLGRPVAVDWSLPKNVYDKLHTKAPRRPASAPTEKNNSYGFQSSSDAPEQMEEEEEEEDDESQPDDDDEPEEDSVEAEEISKPRTNESSRDVREHRTLFVRNVPFDATEEELANVLSSNKERRISSCRLVIDRISKHPRGSAFVQFVSAEDAEACLKSSFTLRGQNLYADMALGRGELVQAKEIREKTYEDHRKQDQRNLSLAKYGVILDLKELDGDENDLRRRQQLEDAKKQKLKDPIHFISTTRLTIHNLPKTIDDAQLRKLVLQRLKEAQIPMKDVVLNECRVMKTNKDTKKSLGFGFINVTRHEIALRLIELLNNNKEIFGANRRPIVQFAIESRRALQLKEQRRERIQAKQELLKNPTDKVLSFATDTKSKRPGRKLFDEKTNQTRLSDLMKQQQKEAAEGQNEEAAVANKARGMSQGGKNASRQYGNGDVNGGKRRQRPKTKSKGEIRDKLDRMIASTRNKPQMPARTKQKWFE